MASIDDISAGLARNLAAITGIQTSAYMLANPTPPSAHVFPGPTEFDLTSQRGIDVITMTVQVFVSLVSDIGGQKRLNAFMAGSGAQSVKEQIEADPTLGGACADLRVVNCSGLKQYVFEGRPSCFGAEWRVDVYASGT